MQTPVRGYGLGLYILTEHGRLIVEHNGRDAGYRSHLIRYPDEPLAVALLGNILLEDDEMTKRLVRKVADVYLGAPLAAAPQHPAEASHVPFTPANPAEYVGRYYSDEIDTVYDIILHGASLQVTRKKYDPTPLRPLFGDNFKMQKNFSNVLTQGALQFSRDGMGRVNGFRIDDNSSAECITNFRFTKLQ
jgi:hypothetical protein